MRTHATRPDGFRLAAIAVLGALFFVSSIGSAEEVKSDDLLIKPGKEGFITSWLQLGTVAAPTGKKIRAEVLADRDHIGIADLEKSPRLGDISAGRRWKARFSSSRGLRFHGPRTGTIYLAAVIRTEQSRKMWFSSGSDGGVEIWCNQKQLLKRSVKRRAVPDTDLVALDLLPGDNLIVLKLWKSDTRIWRVYTRLMDEHFDLPGNVSIVLPGASSKLTHGLEKAGRLVIQRELDLEAQRVDVTLRYVFQGGRPIAEKMPSRVAFVGPGAPEAIDGTADLSIDGPTDLALGTFRFDAERAPSVIRVKIGTLKFKEHLGFRMRDIKGLADAQSNLNGALKRDDMPGSSIESAAWRIDHLKSLIENGDRDYRYLTREIKDTRAIAKTLVDGRDPYFGRRGEVQRRGYRSEIDGSYSSYTLYVPPQWREKGERRFGLVVSLHGINGSPMRNTMTIFGKPLLEGGSQMARERHPGKVGQSPFFVLSPSAFGNSGYRAFGEVDVRKAIDQVRERYRIDPDRIYITGFSMGGIGSASIPLHKPDLFAAAVPLCGYHSLFIYKSIRKTRLRPWEKFLASFRSNKDWALNGKYLPLYIVHGLRDNPLHSRVLVDQYNLLGYKMIYQTPDEGHNVWTQTYEDRKIFSHFARYKRKTHPRKIVFKTSRLRYRKSHWITIDDVVDFAGWADIDATWEKNNEILIKTNNIAAFVVKNETTLRGEAPVVLVVDGQRFEAAKEAQDWQFYLEGAKWTEGPKPKCEKLCKRPELAGPIGDALYEPLLFVFGTGDSAEAILARRRIEELRKPWGGVTVDWPVKADVDVTKADIEQYSLVLVGTPKGNRLISQIADRLPIRIADNSVTMGNQKYTGQTVAASLIYPNPLNPNRYVVVHTGVSKKALYYVAHPPRLIPDYLIYDASKWARKGGRVLGDDRDVLAGGFFDKYWQPRPR